MGSVPLHYIDLRAFAYATEDEPRVVRALETFLPETVELSRETTSGHHGDRIVVLTARIDTADEIRHVLGRLHELEDFGSLLDELEDRVDDDCSFYVSFDKQAAYRGSVSRGTGIRLRAKVEAYPARRDAAIANARVALMAVD